MNQETKSRYYKVFTKKLAIKLCDCGFKIEAVDRNNKKPWLYVYLFQDTEALRQAVQQYK